MIRKLWSLKRDEVAQISGVNSSLDISFHKRLRDFGFEQGKSIKCVQAPPFGAPKVFLIDESCFSLDSDLASYIEID